MQLTQRFYPQDKQQLEQLGAKDVMFFTVDLADGWLLCIIHSREPVAPEKAKLHLSVTVRPAWGMIRGRRATDEEMEVLKTNFSNVQFKENNAGIKDGFVRNLWETDDASPSSQVD